MRAARIASSARLQRVANLLADGRPHSSRDIVRKAKVVAVSSCIAELRVNGAVIACEQRNDERGRRWIYTMTKGPDLG
jgi:hypothetical protein